MKCCWYSKSYREKKKEAGEAPYCEEGHVCDVWKFGATNSVLSLPQYTVQ
jgi:hypothetical protein